MKAFFLVGLTIIALLLKTGYCQEKPVRLPIAVDRYTFTSFFNGKEFYTEFTEKEVSDTPSWDPEKENAPIPLNKALKESRKFLGKYVSNLISWDIESVKYVLISKGKWVCVTSFYLDGQIAKDGLSATFTVILKMDGSFFEPKVTALDKH